MTETKSKLFTALVAAQSKMGDPIKDGNNPHFKSRFVTLKGVLDSVRGPLHSEGIALIQLIAMNNGVQCVETILAHSSGESISSYCPIICAKPNDPQAFGSATTYARRYGAAAICAVAPSDDDDDGEAAAAPPARKQLAQPSKPPTEQPAAKSANAFALAEEAIAAIEQATTQEVLVAIGKRIAASKFTGVDAENVRNAWVERRNEIKSGAPA
jgi:hypothetical protein